MKNSRKSSARNFVIILTACMLALPTAHAATLAYQNAVLADSPYLYYRLGESSGTTAADTSGNSRPGTYTNGPTLGQPGATGGDTAVSFDGINDYVATSNALGFGSSLGSSSYEFVLRTTTSTGADLFGSINNGNNTAILFSLNRTTGNAVQADSVRMFIRSQGGAGIDAVFTNASLFNGDFQHLVITYDRAVTAPADRINAYVNGVAQTLTVNGATSTNFANFEFAPTLGARNNRGTIESFFPGTIDEFAMYDRVLTSAQVNAHFAALIPEPSTALLSGLGLFTLILRRRR